MLDWRKIVQDRRRAYVALLLFSVVVINYIDRVALSVAAKPIANEFDLSPVTMGYLFSCFLWTYVPALIPIGILLDRTGPKRMVGGGVALWSIATVAFGAATSFTPLLIARLTMGLGEATTFPSMGRVVRDWIPQRERALVTTLANTGSSVGPALGAVLTGLLVTSIGWRGAFVVLGALGFIWLLIWWRAFDQPERAGWLGDTERAMILSERNGSRPVTALLPASPISHLLRQRSVQGVMLTQACIVYTTYLFASWLPSYLQSRFGLSIASAGFYTAVPYLLTSCAGLAIAWSSDRFLSAEAVNSGARRRFIAGMLIISLAILAAPFTTALWQLLLVLTLVLTGSTSASSLNFTMASDLLENPSDAGRITSMGALLDQVDGPVTSFTADGAYDQDGVYDEVAAHYPEASVIVPPGSSAVPSDTAETAPTMRDRHLKIIAERGRRAWQKAAGYNWRALVEADISRFKRVIGNGLRSRTAHRRATEVAIAVSAMNRMLELGRPEYVRLP